jgi:hypothetical protein
MTRPPSGFRLPGDHTEMDAKVKAIGERDRAHRSHGDQTVRVRHVRPWSLKADRA